jgi:hypothetical protein
MERPGWVAQLYGYIICLVALVTIIFTLPRFIDNVFRLSDPLQSDAGYEPALSSFEAYKATYARSRGPVPREEGAAAGAPPTDAELRKGYDALRADRLARGRFEARRSLVSQGLLLVLSLGLFVGHWRWLRRLSAGPAALGR